MLPFDPWKPRILLLKQIFSSKEKQNSRGSNITFPLRIYYTIETRKGGECSRLP